MLWSVPIQKVPQVSQHFCLAKLYSLFHQHWSGQQWICLDNFTSYHTDTEATDQAYNPTQSQYTDTQPTSANTDHKTQDVLQGSPWRFNFQVTGMILLDIQP